MSTFLTDLGASEAFRTGLILGFVGIVIGIVAAGVRPRSTPLPLGGVLFAAAATGSLWLAFPVPIGVPAGIALMVLGVLLGATVWDRSLGAVPGAIVLIVFGEMGRGAVIPLAIGLIAIAAGLVVDFDATFRRSAVGLPLLAVSVVGVIITVPDTERAMALVGAGLPLAIIGWPLRFASLGAGGAAAVGLVGWVGALAWTGRPGAVIGAIASLGLMLAEPVGRRLAGNRPTALANLAASGPVGAVLVIGAHGLLVLGASRIAGLRQGFWPALAIAVLILSIGAVLGAAPLKVKAQPPPGAGSTSQVRRTDPYSSPEGDNPPGE